MSSTEFSITITSIELETEKKAQRELKESHLVHSLAEVYSNHGDNLVYFSPYLGNCGKIKLFDCFNCSCFHALLITNEY